MTIERRGYLADLSLNAQPSTLNGPEGWGLAARASVFYTVDQSWASDVMAPGCFAADLPEFLERGFVGGIGHNWETPIGRPVRAEERSDGLYIEGTLSRTPHGEEVRTLIADGVLKYVSIGFRALEVSPLAGPAEALAWWKEVGYEPTPRDLARAQNGVRRVERAKLYEFSPVAVPACDDAAIVAYKRAVAGGVEGCWLRVEGSDRTRSDPSTLNPHPSTAQEVRRVLVQLAVLSARGAGVRLG